MAIESNSHQSPSADGRPNPGAGEPEELRLWTEPFFSEAAVGIEANTMFASQPASASGETSSRAAAVPPAPAHSDPQRPPPQAGHGTPPALPARRFETYVFVDRLREAAANSSEAGHVTVPVLQTPMSPTAVAYEPPIAFEPLPELAPAPQPPAAPAPATATAAGSAGTAGPPAASGSVGGGHLDKPSIRPQRTRERHDAGRPGALGRFIGGLRSPGPVRPSPAGPDPAAAQIARELSVRGASEAWTSQLITLAAAHGRPLLGDLRTATQAEVARAILPAPALPADGAAIAFVGAGGSGKTRCTAALASAYRRGSTLPVTVLALDNPDDARELRKLLREDDVSVLSLSGERARRAIESARAGGVVILDTEAVTPTDPHAVQALQAKLASLALDAVYVALPATLGSQAARRALASFDTLQPAAVAITHADETDQLAVTVEIAATERMPLAFLHSGTDHRHALSAVDPLALAKQLLAQEGAKHGPLGRLYGADGTVVRVSISDRQQEILLTVLDDPGTLYDQPLAGLTLESDGGRGVLRTLGTGLRTDTNLIRFFPGDADATVRRRQFTRIPTAQRIMFVDHERRVIANTVTANVSGGGMLVRRPSTGPLDGSVSFDLYLDETADGARISGSGMVVRDAGDDGTAIRIAQLSRADRERLTHFIFEKQRLALHAYSQR